MNSWVGFCLYVAGGVFIQDQRSDERHTSSIPNLEFLLAAMKAVGNRHSITKHFTAQLELDIEGAGIKPNIPLNGILAQRSGSPMTATEIRSFTFGEQNTYTDSNGKPRIETVCTYISGLGRGSTSFAKDKLRHLYGVMPKEPSESSKAAHPPYGITPSSVFGVPPNGSSHSALPHFGILPRELPDSPTANHPPEGIHEHVHPSLPNWNQPPNTALDGPSNSNQFNKQQQSVSFESQNFASSNPVPADPNAPAGGSPFNIDSFLAGNTPSSDSSGSNAIQFPYRQGGPNSNNQSPPDYSMFQGDPNSFIATTDWTTDIPFNTETQDDLYGTLVSDRRPSPTDAARVFMETQSWSQNPQPPHG